MYKEILLVILFTFLYTLIGSIVAVKLYFYRKELVELEDRIIKLTRDIKEGAKNLNQILLIIDILLKLKQQIYSKIKIYIIDYITHKLFKILKGKFFSKLWLKPLLKRIVNI